MLDADIASSIFNYLRTYLNSCPFLKRLYCLCKPIIPLPVRTNHKAKNKDPRKAGMEPLAKSTMARTIAKGANTNKIILQGKFFLVNATIAIGMATQKAGIRYGYENPKNDRIIFKTKLTPNIINKIIKLTRMLVLAGSSKYLS